MGFDLKPKKKDAGWYHMKVFSWSWMLNHGVGLAIGTGPGVEPATFVYVSRPDGLCPHYNDGCKVSAKEAKDMAELARLIANYQDTLYGVWMQEPEEKRKRIEGNITGPYNLPVRRDFVEDIRAFADWAEKSGGFEIH